MLLTLYKYITLMFYNLMVIKRMQWNRLKKISLHYFRHFLGGSGRREAAGAAGGGGGPKQTAETDV